MQERDWRLDNAAHELHYGDRIFPCDRDIESFACWAGHALLLSSDTDCLSLWDAEGLVRTIRVGVYPQDMAIVGNQAVVCGGADGCIHLLELPELQICSSYPLPGMPENIALADDRAYVLTLMTDTEVQTALIEVDLLCGRYRKLAALFGIPGAITLDTAGLWVAVSEMLLHFPHDRAEPDVMIQGFGLIDRITLLPDGLYLSDALEGRAYRLHRNGMHWTPIPIRT